MKLWHDQKLLFLCMLCVLLLLIVPQAVGDNYFFQVKGLSGNLQRNVQIYLSNISTEEVTTTYAHLKMRVDQAIREGLKALGYYSPIIYFNCCKSVNNVNSDVLIANVVPGKPVKIIGINIILRGDARQDIDYRQLVSESKLLLGTVLNHGIYEQFKNNLSKLALHKGYFCAKFCKSQLIILPDRCQAYWNIDFNSGKRYLFSKIRFHGAQIREDYLQNLAKVHKGDPYSTESLAEINRRIVASNWFNSVVIFPDFNNCKNNRDLSLDAIVTARTRNSIETGLGYATDVGPRVKMTWSKPWLNSCGHSMHSNTSISEQEQLFYVSYNIPLLKDPEQYYLIQGGFKRFNINHIRDSSITLNLARYWSLSSGWQRVVNLRWNIDNFVQDNSTNTTMLIYPGISINRTRQHGAIMPTWGDSQRYSIDISNTIWGLDIYFLMLQAQNIWIRTLNKKHRFVMYGNLGWIETNDFEHVPPALRFFAGGDRSIRGYKYKSLSPQNDDGKLTGSSKLAIGSLEYQYNITNKWWTAVFVDSGEAVNDIKDINIKIGVGFGVRWQSPVGPIKLDIATPIADNHEHGLQFYIGLGPEL